MNLKLIAVFAVPLFILSCEGSDSGSGSTAPTAQVSSTEKALATQAGENASFAVTAFDSSNEAQKAKYLSAVALTFLSAIDGSSEKATSANANSASSSSKAMAAVLSQGTLNFTTGCDSSGNIATTGSYSLEGSSVDISSAKQRLSSSISIDSKNVFNACNTGSFTINGESNLKSASSTVATFDNFSSDVDIEELTFVGDITGGIALKAEGDTDGVTLAYAMSFNSTFSNDVIKLTMVMDFDGVSCSIAYSENVKISSNFVTPSTNTCNF